MEQVTQFWTAFKDEERDQGRKNFIRITLGNIDGISVSVRSVKTNELIR